VSTNDFRSELFWHEMKEQRRICAQSRFKARSQAGAGMPYALPQRSLLRWIGEQQSFASTDDLNVTASLLQQGCEIDG
jgi:hypothetical protein